jgi:hypothetical protein
MTCTDEIIYWKVGIAVDVKTSCLNLLQRAQFHNVGNTLAAEQSCQVYILL